MTKLSAAALILAAGRGSRIGGLQPKQYISLNGKALIRRTAECFLTYKNNKKEIIAPVIIVVNSGDRILYEQALGDLRDKIILAEGGATRQESVLSGLRALNRQEHMPDYVHIHDGARPFVSHALLDKIHAGLTPQNGIVPALPIAETLKRVDKRGFIVETLAREGLYAAQTPQSFPFLKILEIHEKAAAANRNDFTDDSAPAEVYGLPVKYIEGDSNNIKITWEKDIAVANRLLQMTENNTLRSENAPLSPPFPDIRTGNGYDVHRLGSGDGVILCGVKIPCPLALQGHSDADAALHALTDALLATCGAGDIGVHFPPSNPRWKGVDSAVFVNHAAEIVRKNGGQIINIDISLICETPQISPYRAAMIKSLQTMLQLPQERVSVKATTNETLGFIGRQEGIAAIATVNVFYKHDNI